MDVFPAIDLLGGAAVRLHQGRYDSATIYDRDPEAIAARWRDVATWLHVVDLEGARAGRIVQQGALRAIVAAFGTGVQIGGGIRTADAAETCFELGAARVVLGTAALEDPDALRAIARAHPRRIVVAVDARDGRVATRGWEHLTEVMAIDLARGLGDVPLAAILYTDVARDGTGSGPNVVATRELAAASPHPVLASGGVGSLDHIRELAGMANVAGVIIGRALYERAFTLEQALAVLSHG